LLYICNAALTQLRDRLPIPEPAPITFTTKAAAPAATRPAAVIPNDAELVFMQHFGTQTAGSAVTHYVVFPDPAGLLPAYARLVRDDDLQQRLPHLPYGVLGRAVFSANRQELLAIRPILHEPGETAADGFVFSGSMIVKNGKWENPAVMLSKFGRKMTALIPNRHQSDGSWAPDSAMSKTLAGLQPGDVVDAGLEPGPGTPILRYLASYRPPISAKWGRLTTVTIDGAEQPAAELKVARRSMTCRLPDSRSPLPTMDRQALAALPADADLRATIDDLEAATPTLLSVGLDGGVAHNWDRSVVTVRAGRVVFLAKRESDWHGTLTSSEAFNSATKLLRAGLTQYLANPPKELKPEDISALRSLVKSASIFPEVPASDPLPELIPKWLSADDSVRPAIETEMESRLVQFSIDLSQRQAYLRWKTRSILTPKQYRDAIALGRPFARPPAPTTQP
jgi:hypothetical protein